MNNFYINKNGALIKVNLFHGRGIEYTFYNSDSIYLSFVCTYKNKNIKSLISINAEKRIEIKDE